MKRQRKISEYGQSWAVAVTMLDGPKTLDEIIKHFKVVKRRFGVFNDLEDNSQSYIKMTIDNLIAKGWVEIKRNKYRLTPEGKKEAEKAYDEVKERREWIQNRLFNPITASSITLIVHFLLALIKLPVGIISGSVGLLNDGVDTLLDGLSSLLVYFGIKFDKEKIVNIILITIMFSTGLFTLYQAVRRLFIPVENSIDLLTFSAVIISALISMVLMIYQRYVGVKENSFSLITQSVDSKNHLIVAGGVIAGMCGSLLRFEIVDTLVGIAVAFLILKGAVELILEVIKGEDDTSRYDMFSFSKRFFRKRLANWMMREIDNNLLSRAELMEAGREVLNFNNNVTLESMGLNKYNNTEKNLKETIDELIEEGLIVEGEQLELSSRGKNKMCRINHIYSSDCNFRYLFNYIVVFPLCLLSFLMLYYILLAGLSYIPATHLWQKIDITLFSIAFPWFNTVYSFTLMNIIHLVIGFSIYIYAVYHFINITVENHNVRDPETRKPHKLITDGYYGKVRHPMYSMMILVNTSFFFSHKSWLSLLINLIMVTVLLLNGWYEERYELLPMFGEEYKNYKEKVVNYYFNRGTGIIVLLLIIITLIGIIL